MASSGTEDYVRAQLALALATLCLVVGCASADDEAASAVTSVRSSTAPPSGEPTTSPTPAKNVAENVVAVDVTITGGQVEPPPGRVEVRQGQTVRITVTSDEHDELHVHGYDLELELLPGDPRTIEFVADQTGLFEVENHHSGLQLFQLMVQ
jgi:FtsP/CotA-like multicopper oxidase with cupredoxin domain